MAYINLSSNHGSTLNSHINSVFNQGAHCSSSAVWKTTKGNELFTKITIMFASLKRNFGKTSKEKNNHVYISKSKITHPFINQCVDVYKSANIRSLQRSILAPNIKTRHSYLQPNTRCSHLFNQIHTFRTGRNIKNDGSNAKLMPNNYFMFGLFESKLKNPVKDDLNGFYKDLNNKNLSPEENQRALLAYVEGYVTGKESGYKQPRWKFYNFLLSTGLTLGMLYFLYKSGILSIGFDDNVSLDLTGVKVRFSDVKGADEAKEELKNVVEFLKNPEKFSALGGKLPKGVLLVGPPGTGKTLLAKAVAGEAGVPFFNKSGPEFDEIYVGIGAKRVRDLFRLAKENAPCVIFIDEIDSIGKERTSSTHHPHANNTINQLLTEMDGFRSNSGIIILGATNRKEDLDRALLRPGRFDVEVDVSIPDYNGRKELFDYYLDRIRHRGINVEELARGTTNFTGADIENMVNQAALRAASVGAKFVTTEHLEYARDKAIMGPERLSKILDKETNKITAYHEGGHTVVAYYTEHAQPLHKVTIIARGSSLGHTSYIPDKDVYHVTKTQLLAMIDTMMGGRAAEELIFGTEKITSGASSDLQKATDLASKMVKKWGMSNEVGLTTYNNQTPMSPQTANLIDSEVKKILNESYERAKMILITHQDKHRELSEALIKYETLDAEEINTIMKGKSIRRPKDSKFP